MRLRIAVVALAMTAALPAGAGQSGAALDLWSPPIDLARTDTGKPVIFSPPPVLPRGTENCFPGMACGLRLLGNVQRNGAVELQVPAWRW